MCLQSTDLPLVILLADTALGAYLQWPLLHYALTVESITWKLLNTYSKVDKSLSTVLLTLLFIHGNKLMVSKRLSTFYHWSITTYIGQINSSSLCREEQGRQDSNAERWSWIVSWVTNVCIYIYIYIYLWLQCWSYIKVSQIIRGKRN